MKDIDFHNEQVLRLINEYNVKTVRIFGSVARGEARRESDVDILVTFSKPISLLQMVSLERKLSMAFGRKVDLVTAKSVSKYLRKKIIRESLPIYAA